MIPAQAQVRRRRLKTAAFVLLALLAMPVVLAIFLVRLAGDSR